MMGYILLSIVKILDNIILTAKSICTYKEKRVLSSILVVISQLIFYLVINQVINDNTMMAIIIVSVSSGIGNYIAFLINDKFKKDVKFTIVVTSSDKADVSKFCNYLSLSKVKHVANYGQTRKGEDTIHIIIFSKSKQESRLIDKYIEMSHSKYLKEVI